MCCGRPKSVNQIVMANEVSKFQSTIDQPRKSTISNIIVKISKAIDFPSVARTRLFKDQNFSNFIWWLVLALAAMQNSSDPVTETSIDNDVSNQLFQYLKSMN